MKKTYTIKNYKGNLVESLAKFQKRHPTSKIVESKINGKNLNVIVEAIDPAYIDDFYREPPNDEWVPKLVEELYSAHDKFQAVFAKALNDVFYRMFENDEPTDEMVEYFNTVVKPAVEKIVAFATKIPNMAINKNELQAKFTAFMDLLDNYVTLANGNGPEDFR